MDLSRTRPGIWEIQLPLEGCILYSYLKILSFDWVYTIYDRKPNKSDDLSPVCRSLPPVAAVIWSLKHNRAQRSTLCINALRKTNIHTSNIIPAASRTVLDKHGALIKVEIRADSRSVFNMWWTLCGSCSRPFSGLIGAETESECRGHAVCSNLSSLPPSCQRKTNLRRLKITSGGI